MHSVNSQDKFFHILKPELLKELLCRFNTGLIATHISAARLLNKELDQTIKVKSKYTDGTKSLYISYSRTNTKVYHFSIHLYPTYLNPKSNGPIHFKLNSYNISKPIISIPLLVRGSSRGSNSIVFNVKNASNQTSQHMQEIGVLRNILNAYFNKDHPYYLGNRLCIHNTISNKTVEQMSSNIQNILSRHITTRRQPRNRR